jgi:hypothetical protein
MTHIPRALIPLQAVAMIAETGRRVLGWWINPRCHLCDERQSDPELHLYWDHSEFPDISPERDERWHG